MKNNLYQQEYSETEENEIQGENPLDLIGDWTGDSVYTQTGTLYDGTLSFYEDGTLEFASGKSEEIYENYYNGRWNYIEEEENQPYRGVVEIELTRTEESSAEAEEMINGGYLILQYGEEIISVSLLDGDYLFPEQYWNEMTMSRTVG